MVEHDFKKFPELTNAQLNEFGLESPHKQITSDFLAEVVEVHDGDTITLKTDFRNFDFSMRFLDIDTPELNTGIPGEESRDWLKERIQGEEVQIRIDPNNRVDKFGRLLGRVLHTGLDVGQEMLVWGLALPFNRRRETELPDMNKELNINKWLA